MCISVQPYLLNFMLNVHLYFLETLRGKSLTVLANDCIVFFRKWSIFLDIVIIAFQYGAVIIYFGESGRL